ncbi:DUF445 domain-containing protein [Saccharomonospora viridis]|uniref:DUF445 domain-containing protein n=2 Tax=Saccharomonospora viridis TaxID=1852 RepID=C7MQ62_SACVD|nr:DUF445 family protein [Saccharomonospora viridis]ACU98485.1 hypothetical protein Svir_35270 [Saccharomonospora viridis DSM 43017]KHF44278.1 hypothetical protein MINT15_11600 [Saccharomonospora viridis]SFP60877.1 Protein of unknown function [Saccharomonospora viridis]
METVLADLAANWPLYAAIPVVAALIGYVTKRVAIEMMFRPMEFVGIKGTFLGWQGVVPRHGGRMAATATDLLTRNVLDVSDVFARINPDRLLREIEQPLLKAVDDITREVLSEHHPRLWQRLPPMAQDLVVKHIQAASPRLFRQVMDELRNNIGDILDIKHLSVQRLTRNKALLVKLIRETSRPEMAFIARSGIYFGFILGIVQSIVWALTKNPLVMPIFGAAIGFFTDWLAIKLIFVPRDPIRLPGGFVLQGLFQRRRAEVARQYGDMIAGELLTVRNLMEGIFDGPKSDRLVAIVRKLVAEAIDEQVQSAGPLMHATIGQQRLDEMKDAAATKVLERLPDILRHADGYLTRAMDVTNIVEQRMMRMTSLEYEGLLRPAFRQDEWKLIAVGGAIGFVVGELQVLLMLH